jgi:hypothetical protein
MFHPAASSEPAPPASAGSQLAQEISKDVAGESEQLAQEIWKDAVGKSEPEDDGVPIYHCPMYYLLSNSNRPGIFLTRLATKWNCASIRT